MKANKMRFKLAAYLAGIGLALTPVALAQSKGNQENAGTAGKNQMESRPNGAAASEPAGMQSNEGGVQNNQQFYHAKQIIGATANNTAGQKLGRIHDVVFNPQNGEMFAAVAVGDHRFALVPWQALSVTTTLGNHGWWWNSGREEKVTINTSKESLQSAPSISGKESQRLNDPSFTEKIYSYYNVQAPARAMGGTSESNLGGASQGQGRSTPNSNPWGAGSSNQKK
jgi:PRC-barrel domain